MPPRKARNAAQTSFLENYGKTAPAVPAIREQMWAWRDSGYKGATETSRRLLNYWFHTDHKLPNNRLFRYHTAQKEAIETLIYVFEVAQTRTQKDLLERFVPAELASQIRLPEFDQFARYAIKMATGSGKSKVMSLAIAWQYFNAVLENDPAYARTFLIVAPNVIVFERLRLDFGGGRIFKEDPVVPKDMQIYWEMQYYMRGDSERGSSEGAVYLANIQQLYDRTPQEDDEPEVMTAVLGPKPSPTLDAQADFRERILKRGPNRLMVINDEAHHTHDPKSTWNETIRSLHESHASGLSAQLDFSATPRHNSGALFAWTISDYTLKQAILDGIVKRPIKGITEMQEAPSDIASVRYQAFITAGIERWREYRAQLEPLGKKPLLFIMMNDTTEADSISDYLQKKYPDEFGGDKTLLIHTKRNGDIAEGDLERARIAAREVDSGDSPVNAIVSVLMLREGWDVQNVTVVVGLRPYTSKSDILPEQTIGRGLRLMFRDLNTPYQERVDIIGNTGFIKFVEQLEKDEDIDLDTWAVGKDKLVITVIEVVPDKADYDIALPTLSPIFARTTSMTDEINAIEVGNIQIQPLPRRRGSREEKTFRYHGMDILTLENLFDREYTIPTAQTSQEVISYYAQVIANELKLPGQFHALAPKVRDFLRERAFGEVVDLDTAEMIDAISRTLTLRATVDVFLGLLRDKLILPQTPSLENPGRLLSSMMSFPWSQAAPVCTKSIFNKTPCDNQFEEDFARFLDRAPDVIRFSKLPIHFGFSIPYTDVIGNLRYYYPDFVVVDSEGTHYLVETKGREDTDVAKKDQAAMIWTESATDLTGQSWQYVKVLQRTFQSLQPIEFADCVYMSRQQLPLDLDDQT